jgi:hypothetical protein
MERASLTDHSGEQAAQKDFVLIRHWRALAGSSDRQRQLATYATGPTLNSS